MSKRVLIVDHHPAIRDGVAQVVREAVPDVTIKAVGSSHEALQAAAGETWDLVTLDVSMPGRGGIEIVPQLKHISPATTVLIYTTHSEDKFGVRSLQAGADGYLTKDQPREHLADAIRALLSGRRYITPVLAERLATLVSGKTGLAGHEILSDREFLVLRRIGAGKSQSGIAAELHLSVKTVGTYRTRVCEKLQLSSTGELIRYAIEHGLAD